MKIIYLLVFVLCSTPIVAQETTMGLFFNTSDSYDGYTLLSNNEYSYLIDNCGYQVNQWESDYKAGQTLYITDEGQLLRGGILSGSFDAGGTGGIFELYDWNNNLLWHYRIANNVFHAHHDMALLPNGNFLCLVWEKKSQNEAQASGRKYSGDVWSESIWEIEIQANNQASIVWEWSIWDHLIQDYDSNELNYGVVGNHPELLDINYIGQDEDTEGDWLHINGISYNESLDQIAISSRNLSEIYIVDHSTTTEESEGHSGGLYNRGGDILYRYGNPQVYDYGNENDQILFRPHNIDWVKEGSWKNQFSIFNNEFIPNTKSQILVWSNPADENGNYFFNFTDGFGEEEILHEYTDAGFYSSILSSIQVLPNDNLLMLEGRSGKITEVNSNNEEVWSYIYPVNKNGNQGIQGGTPLFNYLFRALRYPRDFIGFINKDLTPTVPVELSPNEYQCDINLVTNIVNNQIFKTYEIIGNPVHNQLLIESFYDAQSLGIVMDIYGNKIMGLDITSGLHSYSIDELNTGIYIITIRGSSALLVVH